MTPNLKPGLDLEALAVRCEAAEAPSRDLFRALFDIVFPEPPAPRFLSLRWWFPTTARSRWLHAEWHFEKLAGQKKWNCLALWLCGYSESHSLVLIANALRARASS